MDNCKLISVILPVYNTEKFLRQSIESVLNQTYDEFELVIIDDCSTDSSWEIILEYAKKDKRIICKRNECNSGVSYTSNRALSLTSGRYVARLDSDDYMTPDRLEKQLDFMKANPDCIMVGSQVDLVDEDNSYLHKMIYPQSHEEVSKAIFSFHPFATNSILVDVSKLPENFRWYDPELKIAEDLDMYFRLMPLGKLYNLPDILTVTRERRGSLMRTNYADTFKAISLVRNRAIKEYGILPTLQQRIIMKLQWLAVHIIPSKLMMPIFIFLKSRLMKTA